MRGAGQTQAGAGLSNVRVVDAAGNLLEEITVYRTEMSDSGAASIMVPEPKQGWAGVEVMGSGVVAFAP